MFRPVNLPIVLFATCLLGTSHALASGSHDYCNWMPASDAANKPFVVCHTTKGDRTAPFLPDGFDEKTIAKAREDDIDSIRKLASIYIDLRDFDSSNYWLEKAGDAGDSRSYFDIGVAYNGQGKPADAMIWYRKAAKRGYTRAMLELASAYRQGRGTAQDLQEAVRWCRLSADAGDGFGMFQLGESYRYGSGVDRDPATAIRWYSRAVDHGFPLAASYIGRMYEIGDGVTKDDQQAAQWYSIAATKANDRLSMEQLSKMYAEGRGVPKDTALSRQWADKAQTRPLVMITAPK